MVISDNTLPTNRLFTGLWRDATFETQETRHTRTKTTEATNPPTGGQRTARRHLRPCAGNPEEEAKQDDDMTSKVNFKDTSPDTVSMPPTLKGQGRGEASNRDG